MSSPAADNSIPPAAAPISKRGAGRGNLRARGRGRGGSRAGRRKRLPTPQNREGSEHPRDASEDNEDVGGDAQSEVLCNGQRLKNFSWKGAMKKISLLKEASTIQPYKKDQGGMGKSEKWEEVARLLKEGDPIMFTGVTGHSCKDAMTDIVDKIRQNNKEHLLVSGTEEDYTELEQLAEDYVDDLNEYEDDKKSGKAQAKEKREAEEAKIKVITLDAMKTLGERQWRDTEESGDMEAWVSKRRSETPVNVFADIGGRLLGANKEAAEQDAEYKAKRLKREEERFEQEDRQKQEMMSLERRKLDLEERRLLDKRAKNDQDREDRLKKEENERADRLAKEAADRELQLKLYEMLSRQ